MTKTWTWLKNNFGAILDISIVVTGILVVLLDILGAKPEIVEEATLALLSLIGASLLANHVAYNRLRQWIEDILKHPPQPCTSQVLEPWIQCWSEIEEKLRYVRREVWVLSRTCAGIWWDFKEQFEQLLSDDYSIVRLMLVDPDGSAVQMIADSAMGISDCDLLRKNIKSFFVELAELQPRFKGGLEVRVLDHLPAWTLLLIDPKDDRGVIYVELAAFRANCQKRPTFRLVKKADKEWFERFQEEFEVMWDRAQEIDLSTKTYGVPGATGGGDVTNGSGYDWPTLEKTNPRRRLASDR